SVQDGRLGYDTGGSGLAELLLSIRINGVEVARDQTTLTLGDGAVATCTSNDLGALGDYMGCYAIDYDDGYGNVAYTYAGAEGAARDFTLDLGLIGAGESFTLDYLMLATVYSNDGGSIFAFSGDPFAFSGTPINGYFENSNGNNNNAPEPSSLVLLGLAFAGLGLIRRRQRDRA
ncbi:MAG: PEP-CTERM sorting domain-containing protein, partial [Betaproteobacteria bacterium]|nr:PEP-CTERM sorting domain-containing protein [Betaproteobacteria bacterium]